MPVYPRFDRSTIGLVVPPGGIGSMPTTFWKAPPHSSVSPTRRMTAFSCTLATGSELTFLSANVTVGTSLFMPFSTPASNQPVRTSTGSTSLVMGWLALLPQAAAKQRASSSKQEFGVRACAYLFDTRSTQSSGFSGTNNASRRPACSPSSRVSVRSRRACRSLPLMRRMTVIAVSLGSPGTNRRSSTLSRAATVSHSSAPTPTDPCSRGSR